MIRKLSLGVLMVILAVVGWLHSVDYRPVVERAVANVAAGTASNIDVDPDTVKVLFCGTGSPSRNPYRASPCLALQAYGDLYLFDAGEGAIAKLQEYGAPVLRLKKIFLTHLHSDHMSGVAEVLHNTWLYGREHEAELVGPMGTAKLLEGIRTSYADDLDERMYVLGPDGVVKENAFPLATDVEVDGADIVTVHDDGKLRIEAFLVDHPHWEHAFGYRISVAGKTLVVSGDTTPSDGIRRYAAGVDYLIHEAFNADFMRIVGEQLEQIAVPISASRITRIGEVHTSTLDLADLAAQAQVKQLVLTHLIPPVPNVLPARRAFTSGMDERYEGVITVAYDGMEIALQ
jgi:ribonuclease Z